jgi:pimeloyl-ACP methyl ester carboxylesterase
MRNRRILRPVLGICGALLAASVLVAYLGYRRDLDAAQTRVSSGSRIADTPCGPIEYAVAGAGTPVLVVHGAGGGFDQGLEFGRPLAERGYRVIAPSRFGYLRSPLPPDASPAAQADAYACLLDALKLPKAVIIGGSAGAPSTIAFCQRHAERCRAMVLLVPAFFPPGAFPGGPPARPPLVLDWVLGSDFVFWLNMKVARDFVLEKMFATPARDFEKAAPGEQERVLRVLWDSLPIGPRRAGLWNDLAIVASPPSYALERLAMPVLVVSVEDDLFGIYETARAMTMRIPGARFVSFPTGGHLWVGRQDELVSELSAFLRLQAADPLSRAGG